MLVEVGSSCAFKFIAAQFGVQIAQQRTIELLRGFMQHTVAFLLR